MKAKTTYLICLTILVLAIVMGGTLKTTTADTPEEAPDVIGAIESSAANPLYADITQEGGPSYNFGAIYAELRQLMEQYRRAREKDAKQRIMVRAEELMGQLFDAKVQAEQRRIERMEERLNKEKHRLQEMQSHKRDLVHQGVQKAFKTGEMPDWAREDKDSR